MNQRDGTEKRFTDNPEFVSVNDTLQVNVPDDPNSPTCHSRVNNITDGQVVIAWPTQGGIRLPVKNKQKLSFSYLHNNVPYAFDGVAVERKDSPIPEITIQPAGSVVKTQRRQNFRVKCLVPVEITGTADVPPGSDSSKHLLFIKTTTADLSAGGLSVLLPKTLAEGTLLEIKLSLPDKAPVLKIPCRIAYTRQIPENVSMYHWGIQFLAVSEREQARIIRYLQKQQLQRVLD